MRELTVNDTGAITIDTDEILQHMGVVAGDKIEFYFLPDGGIRLHPAKATESYEKKYKLTDLIGLWAGKTDKVASLEEIQDTIAKGWAGQLAKD